jgi:HEAT repeat protein
MSLADVYQMKETGNVPGLVSALSDDDEYVRRVAVDALAGFPGNQVRDVLEWMRFDDPVALVRETAVCAYARVVAALQGREQQ